MIRIASLLAGLIILGACEEHGHDEDDAHVHKGSHGGTVLDISGGQGHLEIVHDEEAGKMTIYVLGDDMKTPIMLAKPPQLKLSTDDENMVLDTQPTNQADGTASVFTVTHDGLKVHEVEGRISLEIGGKVYNTTIEHDHEH